MPRSSTNKPRAATSQGRAASGRDYDEIDDFLSSYLDVRTPPSGRQTNTTDLHASRSSGSQDLRPGSSYPSKVEWNVGLGLPDLTGQVQKSTNKPVAFGGFADIWPCVWVPVNGPPQKVSLEIYVTTVNFQVAGLIRFTLGCSQSNKAL